MINTNQLITVFIGLVVIMSFLFAIDQVGAEEIKNQVIQTCKENR